MILAIILYFVIGILSIGLYNITYKGFKEEKEEYIWIPIKTTKEVLVVIIFFSLFVPWIIMYGILKPVILRLC